MHWRISAAVVKSEITKRESTLEKDLAEEVGATLTSTGPGPAPD
jgi:hypothetical protein